ncbi:MAG: ABC transporter ATP-binding protein [Steroidobacteraceae bacterium]
MTEAVINLRGIVTRFGDRLIHDGIDLEVQRGEVLALVGGSGSGKTTLLREMIGLQRPEAGEVAVFGRDMLAMRGAELAALRRRWGVLFQHGALFSALPVADNIAFPLRELKRLRRAEIDRLVLRKLMQVGLLAEDGARLPAELSGGMIKRAALARSLVLEPELLLLDEPTAGLDPVASEQFVALIRRLRTDLGLTVVMVTHDLDTIRDLCDRIAVLAERRIVALGSLAEVTAIGHPFVRDYFLGTRGARRVVD